MAHVNFESLMVKKGQREKIIMLTAYDYPMAALVDACEVDMILVGDSLAQVVLGLESTRDVDLDGMLHHTKAVRRAVKRAMLIGDLPYSAYQPPGVPVVENARRMIQEAGCDAVKVEWFDRCPQVVTALMDAGIPIMGHVGLTPQTAEQLGGFKVQGRDAMAAQQILHQAKDLEACGCFSIVLECIPSQLAALITQTLRIPTIGIGAGAACDGQVLVFHDLLGLFARFHPKFVKSYADVASPIREGIQTFCREVKEGIFPDDHHSYHMNPAEWEKVKTQGP
jgi:3-methyl-2-oxobutanoate hydroxymethyltransferase